jgi:hypothetical protein
VTEPPAEIMRRARPIPTSPGPPTTLPRDVVGVDPGGAACRIEVEKATAPVLLLFLSAECLGCRDLWEGLGELSAGLGDEARLAVVTKSPGDEDPPAIAALAGETSERLGVPVVMSSSAYGDYRVGGPPFMALAAPEAVRTESVAWGVEQTLRTALEALGRA